MKVEKIKVNYDNFGAHKSASSSPKFKGNLGGLKPRIKEQLPNKKAIAIMEKIKKWQGEGGGIVINALGTGAIAPIFIAFNPLVRPPKNASEEEKEEVKNTKQYTAWRQPISAVLAAGIQLSILDPVNKVLDSTFNNPKLAKNLWLDLDQSVLNNDDYLKKLVKKEIKAENLKITDKKELEAEIEKRVDAKKAQQVEQVAKDFEKTGIIKIGERNVNNKIVAEILNSQVDKYIEDAREYIIKEEGRVYYAKRAKLLMENEAPLRQILEKVPEDSKQVTNYLKEQIANSDNAEVKKILQEIIDEVPENLRGSKCARTLERFEKIKKACGGTYSPKKYLDSMLEDNKALNGLIQKLHESKISNLDGATPESIKAAVKEIQGICQYKPNTRLSRILEGTQHYQESAQALFKKINKDIIKGYRGMVANKYKGFNQLTKVLIGMFFTVPVTCTALNWVYPRFMDLFLPHLSGKKKDGGDK